MYEQMNLVKLFDRLASIGRAIQKVREKGEASSGGSAAKQETAKTGHGTHGNGNPATRSHFTLDSGSRQKGVEP